MSEPETTAIVLRNVGHIEDVRARALEALKAGHRVVVTANYNGERSHVFTAVRTATGFQVVSVKGRGKYRTEDEAIAGGMVSAVDFLTYKGPS